MAARRIEISGPALNELLQKLTAAGHRDLIHDGELNFRECRIGLDSTQKPDAVPVTMISILSARTKEGMVQLRVGETVVQMDLDKSREIIDMLHGVTEAAISDQLMYTFLVKSIGLEPDSAGRALLDFRELRQGTRSTSIPN
jgi:hypothetical protein